MVRVASTTRPWPVACLLRLSFLLEVLKDSIVPFDHVFVGRQGERLLWQRPGEQLAGGIANIVLPHRFLKVRDVLVWSQEELDHLPSHKASWLKSGDGGWGVIVAGGLQRVRASQRLVDERQGRVRGVEKERIVIAAHGTIESGQLDGRQAFRVGRFKTVTLRLPSM